MSKRPPLKLTNTLTRVKETFEPIDEKNVRMYVCGPTVYDFAHIGNARPVIVFDVLYRLLRHLYGENHVTYVRNITDVDDKINARALRDYPDLPLNEAIAKVTEKTANQFHEDVKALGCLEPTFEPRATDHIDGMATMIEGLINKGHAYIASGNGGREVLFDVASMANYGALSNRKLEDQQAGARIAVQEHKKNAGDFVLWKESAADQPGWDAVFAGETVRGRPGWHIECSAMSKALLGETFDIHGGGLDLIFPHHENEIAQSCCAHDTPKMANYWMHNGYLQVEGKKMSKSDGNFVTIHDLLHTTKFGGRKWPGEVLRLAMLMTHYKEPIDFSVKRLEEAEKTIQTFAEASFGADAMAYSLRISADSPIYDDLNIGNFITELHRFAKQAKSGNNESAKTLRAALALLGFDQLDILSAQAANQMTMTDHDFMAQIELLANQRLTFIANKNWAEADRIRDELLAQGIQLKDGKDPETGERITAWEVKR